MAMAKNGKVQVTVTIDSSVLAVIEEERGELISRSRFVDYILKKGLTSLRREREGIDAG